MASKLLTFLSDVLVLHSSQTVNTLGDKVVVYSSYIVNHVVNHLIDRVIA